MSPDSPEWPQCRQVKEKTGALRFVVFAIEGHAEVSGRIRDLVAGAQEQSLRICEQCGQPGEAVSEVGIATLCSEHARYLKRLHE